MALHGVGITTVPVECPFCGERFDATVQWQTDATRGATKRPLVVLKLAAVIAPVTHVCGAVDQGGSQ